MRTDHQAEIFDKIKRKIGAQDSMGNVVGDVLSISPDAVYRRYRGETLLTIYELEKLCKHFNISLDSLFEINKDNVLFEFSPLEEYEFSMATYLQNILDGLHLIKAQKNPELIISVNNIPLLQLLNFPHLVRFKLWFWAKTHLQLPEYQDQLFEYEKFAEETFAIGMEVLRIYNTIPSQEIYDATFLRGFAREIQYYFNARLFKDPEYAIYLIELTERFVDHLEAQAKVGKKFTFGTEPPAQGNAFEMYHNETFNGNGATLYKTDEHTGLYITHNLLNFLHTSDNIYIEDSLTVLNKQMANSSMISTVNEKERNSYFFQVRDMLKDVRKKMMLA